MDKLLTTELLSLQYKIADIVVHIEKYQDEHKELIGNAIVKPQLIAMNRLLDALIEACGMGETND